MTLLAASYSNALFTRQGFTNEMVQRWASEIITFVSQQDVCYVQVGVERYGLAFSKYPCQPPYPESSRLAAEQQTNQWRSDCSCIGIWATRDQLTAFSCAIRLVFADFCPPNLSLLPAVAIPSVA